MEPFKFQSQLEGIDGESLLRHAQSEAARLVELANSALDDDPQLRDEFAAIYRSVSLTAIHASTVGGELREQVDEALRSVMGLPPARVRVLCSPLPVDRHPGRMVIGYESGEPFDLRVYPVGLGEYLAHDAASVFLELVARAERDGIRLRPTSGFRTLTEQRYLYERFIRGVGAEAEQPGFSSHQRGVSIDIGGIDGYSSRAYAAVTTYSRALHLVNDVPHEPWHWTYQAPPGSQSGPGHFDVNADPKQRRA